jgi:PIN domain nuclease of toxin-antitoxin system
VSGFLLDTHVLLWLLEDNPRLGSHSRTLIAEGPSYFSAASTWEVELKASVGKVSVPTDFDAAVTASGLRELSVTSAHARATRDIALPHRDPFDALLVAQAAAEGLVLITADAKILAASTDHVQDARV